MLHPRFALPLLLSVFLAACGDDDVGPAPDAGPIPEDGGPLGCNAPELRWSHDSVGAAPGGRREVYLELVRDFNCAEVTIQVSASMPGIATLPPTVSIPVRSSRATMEVEGVAEGVTTFTATWMPPDGMPARTDTLEVVITDDPPAACTGSGSGNVAPGGEVSASGGTIAGSAVAIPAGAARDDDHHVDAFDASIACAPDQVPAGYRALGPAVTFGPVHLRFPREIELTIPIATALLPSRATRAAVEVSYTGPGASTPRIVSLVSPSFAGSAGAGTLTFQTPRLGTWQAVARDAEPMPREREMTFKAITGISMGGAGAAFIGMRNTERFDFVAPLGGPTEWTYLLHYIRTYHLGGFCTADERAADPEGCAMGASVARTPPSAELFQHEQDFEHWWYEDQYDGQGGTFDRHEYVQIFRDLSMMFGNANTTRTADPSQPNITPPGVPDSDRARSDAERCAMPVVIPTGYYDDEYNPDGSLPVISFCDGAERVIGGDRDHGNWDPAGDNDYPVEVALAVDVNGNSRRDPGEPVIRSGHEPFDDCGCDAACNASEAGFDAVTNPDPAGDDYDFQFNPAGTEGNRFRDAARCPGGTSEAFLDVGLDGVIGTDQVDEGGYDFGEADGQWTMARGMERMMERNPRNVLLDMPLDQIRDIDVFADGGIRDLFNFAVVSNHMIAAIGARGFPVRYYNGHAALMLGGATDDRDFSIADTNWDEVGKYVMVRYGSVDATEDQKEAGDGGHVGTAVQVLNRLLSTLAMFGDRWPGVDRTRVMDRVCSSGTAGCTMPNQILFDFTSERAGRTGPVTIVLPPGYFMDEFQDTRYPVVYFGHGYGQEPADLVAIGILLWNFMTAPTIPEAARLPKMIFVFPDGLCRESGGTPECIQGTFYTDAPPSTPNGAQMETFMLDLMDHIDATYRTRSPETVQYLEPVID